MSPLTQNQTSPETAQRGSTAAGAGTKVYVLDTSVLIADPRALFKFAEHDVVIPIVVITELESKRHDPEIGYFARAALRHLDDLRVAHGGLDRPITLGEEGGTLRVELNHIDQAVLPVGFRSTDNDARILAVAKNLANEDFERSVTVVSKDVPMRVKASAMGLAADEYRNELAADSGWTGVQSLAVDALVTEALYDGQTVPVFEARDLPVNTGLITTSPRGSALARVVSGGRVQLVKGDREVFGVRGRSAEQRLALDLLMDPAVGIVSLGGRAGTGKSSLALAAGLEAVMERREHKKVTVFRPLYAVGGQELGYLPGSSEEKMGPWGQAVFDALGSFASQEVIDEVLARGLVEVLPLTHIRGRSLHDAYVIVDEAQSLEKNVLLTVMSRMGQNSKIVLTHDVAQRDNLRVGRHDGIAAVVETLKGQQLFGHVKLMKAERSPIAALVTELLDES